jgi:hypothetical protein
MARGVNTESGNQPVSDYLQRVRNARAAFRDTQTARRHASGDEEFERLNDETLQALDDLWIAIVPRQRQKERPPPGHRDDLS